MQAERRESAKGYELPRRTLAGAAAVPSITDTNAEGRRGRDGPGSDICTATKRVLFYYFVGTGKQRWRDCEADGLRGLEINGQLVFRRRLHREVAGLFALENAIDITGR